jgi:glycerophosphoryl diester phosphodiesterase
MSLDFYCRGLANGVQMLEIDCHMTKDHRAVVHHDATLSRTTGHNEYIRDIDYDVSQTNRYCQMRENTAQNN